MTAMKDADPSARRRLAIKRMEELHAFAGARGVTFNPFEAAGIVLIRMRVDDAREQARARTDAAVRPTAPKSRRATSTKIYVGELLQPDGMFLLLRQGNKAWLVVDMFIGWAEREPWIGGLKAVRWISGPPAEAAFRRVGAPV